MTLTGCLSVSSNTAVIGPDLEFSKPDRRMSGKVTLVELSADGFEQSRSDDPQAVYAGLAMDESAIAAASADDVVDKNTTASHDYMRFAEPRKFADASYPAGRSGQRRLEFVLDSPSKQCKSLKYILHVQWSWRNNRVTGSQVYGDWNQSASSGCLTGVLDAEVIDKLSGSRRRVGMVYNNIFIRFRSPFINRESGEVVNSSSTDGWHYFAGGGVTVRGDGTARFSFKVGVNGR